MNEIEQKFYDAWIDSGEEEKEIEPGKVIGPYKVDFLMHKNYVIEIDGHDSHKTKEQRSKDYKRERFLQTEGYTVIRFMATEVFLDPCSCVEDAQIITGVVDDKIINAFESGVDSGKNFVACPQQPIKIDKKWSKKCQTE